MKNSGEFVKQIVLVQIQFLVGISISQIFDEKVYPRFDQTPFPSFRILHHLIYQQV